MKIGRGSLGRTLFVVLLIVAVFDGQRVFSVHAYTHAKERRAVYDVSACDTTAAECLADECAVCVALGGLFFTPHSTADGEFFIDAGTAITSSAVSPAPTFRELPAYRSRAPPIS